MVKQIVPWYVMNGEAPGVAGGYVHKETAVHEEPTWGKVFCQELYVPWGPHQSGPFLVKCNLWKQQMLE